MWDPRRDTWPPLRDIDIRSRSPLADITGRLATLRDDEDDRSALFQQAIGALSDWRSSLRFLAKLKGNSVGVLDSSVIDSFFLHITGDKHPTYATHAQIARPSSGRSALDLYPMQLSEAVAPNAI